MLGHATAFSLDGWPLCGPETSFSGGGGAVSQNAAPPAAHLNTPQLICQQFCQKHPHSDLTSFKQWQNGTGKTSELQLQARDSIYSTTCLRNRAMPRTPPQKQPPGTWNRKGSQRSKGCWGKRGKVFCVYVWSGIDFRNKEQSFKNSWTTLLFLFTWLLIFR